MIISLDKYKGGGGTKVEGDIAISENGIYDVTTYATASVNVQPSDNYSYFNGAVDVEGLRAIGWDDASIGMYRDNNLHYAWQNSDYIVSEENKALYGVIVDRNSIQNNKDNPNFKYCPYFHISKGLYIAGLFQSCSYLTSIPLLDTSNVAEMSRLFKDCSSLTSIPLLDTSKVTDMDDMFNGCSKLTSIPLLDTHNVKNMSYMFAGCSKLTSIPLLDTHNVKSMTHMFFGCSSLTSIPVLETSNVANMSSMFFSCSKLTSIPLLNTSNATNMGAMFQNCVRLTSIPLLNTTNVTNMVAMFNSCSSLTSIPLLNTSNVTNMNQMFYSCSSLTSIPLLDTSKVTNMGYIFGFGDNKTLTDLGGFKNLSISITSYFLDKCPNLTVESLMNVINNLATVSGKSLSFGSTNLNKLTAEQIAIATNKGWTLT